MTMDACYPKSIIISILHPITSAQGVFKNNGTIVQCVQQDCGNNNSFMVHEEFCSFDFITGHTSLDYPVSIFE
jgi:hypothetical protein